MQDIVYSSFWQLQSKKKIENRDNTLPIVEKLLEWELISRQKPWKPEVVEKHLSSTERKDQSQILCPVKVFVKTEGERTFPDEGKLREFVTHRPTLKE